jgi:hypothetical protein
LAQLVKHKLRRLWASGSPILLGAVPLVGSAIPVLIAAIPSKTTTKANIIAAQSAAPIGVQTSIFILCLGILLAAILLGLHWNSEYRRRTYDPAWALKFGDIFDSREMKKTRVAAAKNLKKDLAHLGNQNYSSGNIDDVLDFFEDVGFYVCGDQLTPEVAHHAFYYWIRGYYLIARPYIEAVQIDRPGQWFYLPRLFEITHEVETQTNTRRTGTGLSGQEIKAFLHEEITLLTQQSSRF